MGDIGLISGLGKSPWGRERLPTIIFLPGKFHGQKNLAGYSPLGREESDMTELLSLCFPGSSDGKESACNAGDLGLIPGLRRSPGEGDGNPLQYSCLEDPRGQRSLVDDSPWGDKGLDMTERVSTQHAHKKDCGLKDDCLNLKQRQEVRGWNIQIEQHAKVVTIKVE